MEWINRETGEMVAAEVYDLEADPHGNQNRDSTLGNEESKSLSELWQEAIQ